MLLQPTADALNTAGDQFKAGNYAPLNNYDDQGNYKPSVASSLMDAVPFVGPWNRNFQNEANTKGVLPALGGLATDMFAPEVAGKIVAPAVNAAGSVARFASADKASANLAATRFFVKGSPGQLLQSALKPSVTYGTGAADMLEKGLPQVISADPNLQGVSGFARASEVAKDASAKPYDDLVAPYRSYPGGRAPRPSSINGAPVADAQLFSMPLMDQLEQPHFNVSPELRPDDNVFASKSATAKTSQSGNSLYGKTANVADNYRYNFDVPFWDEIRKDANGKLNAFYNKSGGDQAAALSNPETARVKAVGDATRGILYPFLDTDNGLAPGTADGMQKNFANMSHIEDIANKREPVYLRKDPVSLAQNTGLGIGDAINPLGAASKMANWALQKKIGAITDSDALVNSAVDRFKNPVATPLVARPGTLPKLGMGFGNAAKNLTPPMIQNALYLAPKNTTGKSKK